ncbi:MAG TPA: SusD/RagB family nutrient-binding outer membrane lipoprotein [Gemmatimonadaceae bacterium]|nr:SusD/RagB family nutrient-binding outer membrane lipoprotein [Gemmatimonadaceae bacterium]
MIKLRYLALVAVGLTAASCKGDYLTGGDLSNDPNRPKTATANQLFAASEGAIWALLGSDPARVTGMWARQFAGGQNQYQSIYNYLYDEGIQSGFNIGLYASGGLVDIVRAEQLARDAANFNLLGITQVQEAITMGTGADLFGNLVYSHALSDEANPPLDDQMAVYDSVETLLTAAIGNLENTDATNSPPFASDLVYGGDVSAWAALAHTLKARFYLHTAEVRGLSAYTAALAEAQQGISSDGGNFFGAFTSNTNETNFYFQFQLLVGRAGYLIPDPLFVSLLSSRNDPRRQDYFNAAGSNLSGTRLAPNYPQVYVSYDENTLIWAEAAYRTGDQVTALAKLNEERANNGLAPEAVAGQALLNEILTEKYIADFQLGHEAWNDYKRTCTPNFPPTQAGQKMPGRMYYDPNERFTNTNIPPAGQGINGSRNPNDPPNAVSDGTGQACLAG